MSDTQNADDAAADLPDNPTPSPASASKPPPPLPPIGLRQPNNPLQNLPAPIRQLFGIPDPQPTGPQITEQRKTQPSYPYSPTGPFPRWPPPWHYAKWQNYVPAQPRDHGQWGQPGVYTNPPARWENPGLYTQIGNFFSQNGSFLSGQNGILLNAFNGAYMKGVMQGQEALAQLEHTKMTNHLLKMEQDEQDQQIQYSDIFDTYGANLQKLQGDPTGGSLMVPEDPNDPNSRKISLHDALWNKAIELHDTNMQRRMMVDGAAGAYKLLQDRDQKWQDLHASNVQRVKEETADKDLAPFTQPGSTPNADGTPNTSAPTEGPPMARDVQGEGAPTAGPMPAAAPQPAAAPEPQPAPEQPPEEAPPEEKPPAGVTVPDDGYRPSLGETQPTGATQPSQTAQAQPQDVASAQAQPVAATAPGPSDQFQIPPGDQVAQADTGGPPDGATATPNIPQYKAPPVRPANTHGGVPFDTSAIDQWGHAMLEDEQDTTSQLRTMGKNVADQFLPVVAQRAMDLRRTLQQIQADKRFDNLDLEQRKKAVGNAIRAIDPMIADRVAGLASGRDRPPIRGGRVTQTQALIDSLASKYDPSFTGNNFYTRGAVMRGFTTGMEGRNLISITTGYDHLKSYQNDLAEFKKLPYDQQLLAQQVFLTGSGRLRPTLEARLLPETRRLAARLENELGTAGNEYERATTGGVPHEGGKERAMGSMDWKSNTADVALDNTNSKIELMGARLKHLQEVFDAGYWGDFPPDKRHMNAMDRLFGNYMQNGGASKGGADELGARETPTAANAATLHQMLTNPSMFGGGKISPEDQQMINWAWDHPDDPRSKEVLGHYDLE